MSSESHNVDDAGTQQAAESQFFTIARKSRFLLVCASLYLAFRGLLTLLRPNDFVGDRIWDARIESEFLRWTLIYAMAGRDVFWAWLVSRIHSSLSGDGEENLTEFARMHLSFWRGVVISTVLVLALQAAMIGHNWYVWREGGEMSEEFHEYMEMRRSRWDR